MAETRAPMDLILRINAYLAGGGLFNPELAKHDGVRDLLIECRAELSAANEKLDAAKEAESRIFGLRIAAELRADNAETKLAQARPSAEALRLAKIHDYKGCVTRPMARDLLRLDALANPNPKE